MTTRPRRRAVVLAAGAIVLAGGGIGAAVALDSGPTPPARPLPQALAAAADAPATLGVTGRVELANSLVDPTVLSAVAGAGAFAGGTGRVWVAADGRFRLELQADRGDTQIVGGGDEIAVVDAATGEAIRLRLPDALPPLLGERAGPSAGSIADALAGARREADVSGAQPRSIAGRAAYEVRVSPRGDGGLVGSVAVAFDAENGTPLEIAVRAAGREAPVLQLRVTKVSYGPASESDLAIPVPSDAALVDLSDPSERAGAGERAGGAVAGLPAVRRAAGFDVAAPGSLVGLPRTDVRLVRADGERTALVTYGRGLGRIVVAQSAAQGAVPGPSALPAVEIDGATGRELATALGTAIAFRQGGVDHVLAGSVPAQAAEAAARELR